MLELVFEEKDHLLQSKFSADTATAAYLTILDGLFVKILYGGRSERLEKRISFGKELIVVNEHRHQAFLTFIYVNLYSNK
ncbi:hypothetical protein [Priestia megaterium]|uniref:hypothetical protein n=1 Tax=Priestia megaterium TaxID=1404 RepID=UPI0030000F69|nr:hypothetical protein [Bacillus sp. S35]